MDIQRLRSLTTRFSHTGSFSHVAEDIKTLTGVSFVTHELQNAHMAAKVVLQKRNLPKRFWNEKYDPEHTGEILVPPFNEAEMQIFWKAYNAGKDPFEGKKVVVIRK